MVYFYLNYITSSLWSIESIFTKFLAGFYTYIRMYIICKTYSTTVSELRCMLKINAMVSRFELYPGIYCIYVCILHS